MERPRLILFRNAPIRNTTACTGTTLEHSEREYSRCVLLALEKAANAERVSSIVRLRTKCENGARAAPLTDGALP
jgi:hypothetical protein